MDIQAEKLILIKWLADIEEPTILRKLIAVKNGEEADWWDMIDDEEKAEIEEGLAEADRGNVIPHEEVMAKYEKWLSK
jgi:hypothetical protein